MTRFSPVSGMAHDCADRASVQIMRMLGCETAPDYMGFVVWKEVAN
jgi:hypothetical protein